MGKMTVKETAHVIKGLSCLIVGENGRSSE